MPRQPLKVGPMDLEPGEGAPNAQLQATIDRVRDTYDKLRPVQALTRDEDRSRDIDLEEVAKVTDANVEGAHVRGQASAEDKDRKVIYSADPGGGGASYKGVVAYTDLPKSIKNYEDRKKRELEAAKAGRAAGGEGGVVDPAVATLQAHIEKLEAELKASRSSKPKSSSDESGDEAA